MKIQKPLDRKPSRKLSNSTVKTIMETLNPPQTETEDTAPVDAPEGPAPTATAPVESAPASVAALQVELAAKNERIAELEAQNQQFTAAKEQEVSWEEIIRSKMQLGLTRAQAAAVVQRQHRLHQDQPDRYLSVEAAHQQSLRHRTS
jgi:hypothetical protein